LSVNNNSIYDRLALGDRVVDRDTYGRRSTSSTLSSSWSHQSHDAKTYEKLKWVKEHSSHTVHDNGGNNLNIYNMFNFNICLTEELMINVIYAAWHVSIQSTATCSLFHHTGWPLDPMHRRITCKLLFFIQDKAIKWLTMSDHVLLHGSQTNQVSHPEILISECEPFFSQET
jgi:hypothetical protein